MIRIFSNSGQYLTDLEDEINAGAKDISTSFKINEISELSFQLPSYNEKVKYLINDNYIDYNGECYVIKTVNPTQSESAARKNTVPCKHFSDILRKKYIVEQSLDPANARTQLGIVLNNTGWNIGTTITEDVMRGFEFDRQTVFEALVKIAETFNAYLEFSATVTDGELTLLVNMYDRSDEVPTKVYTVNGMMQNVNINKNTDDLITRMYCFGGTNPTTGLDVDIIDATVNGQPWGYTYVENYDYYLNQGISAEYILAHPEKFLQEYIWEDSNYVDPDTLFADAVKKIKSLSTPQITVSFTILAQEESHIPHLGEPIYIIDEDDGNTYICQVTGVEHTDDKPMVYSVTVSNVIPYGNIFVKMIRSSNVIKTITNTNGTIKDTSIRDGSITDAKVTSVSFSKLTGVSIDCETIDVINVSADNMKAGTITAASGIIADLAITTEKVANSAITNAKIDRASIDKLVVVTADIADGNITNAKIDRASVDKLVVDTADIALGAIKVGLIDVEAVGTSQIAKGSITDAKIVDLTANKITSGELSTERLIIRNPDDPTKSIIYSINNISGSLQASQGETINGEVLTKRSITADTIVAHDITANEIAAHSITANELKANTIEANSGIIANGAILTAMIGNGQITTAHIGDLSADIIKTGNLSGSNGNIKFLLDEDRLILGKHELKLESDDSLSFTSSINSDVIDYRFQKSTADKCDAEIDGTFHTTHAFAWGSCVAERRDDVNNEGIDFVF